MTRLMLCTLMVLVSTSALARVGFPSLIPNGNNAPAGYSDCQMCHTSSGGGRNWNAFGDAMFVENGGTAGDDGSITAEDPSFIFWNEALCNGDADGDGATNGEELGDPDCIWATGDTTASSAVSMPGFAESTPEAAGGGDGNTDFGDGTSTSSTPEGCAASAPASLIALAAVLRRRKR